MAVVTGAFYQPSPRARVLSLGSEVLSAAISTAKAVNAASRWLTAGSFASSCKASLSEASSACASAALASAASLTRRLRLADVFPAALATTGPMPAGVVSTASTQGRIRLSITVGRFVRSGTWCISLALPLVAKRLPDHSIAEDGLGTNCRRRRIVSLAWEEIAEPTL